MELNIIKTQGVPAAEVDSLQTEISTLQDAVDLLGNAYYQGAESIILREHHMDPSFFDLKTRLAGDILQKFSNYRMKLAIVGDFKKYSSESLSAFIVECNRGGSVFFVPDLETALLRITEKPKS